MSDTVECPCLQALQEEIQPAVFSLYHLKEATCHIGRRVDNQIQIPDSLKSISGLHAIIWKAGDGYWLENKGRNGTFINGRRIHEKRILKDQDEIGFATPQPMMIYLDSHEEYVIDRLVYKDGEFLIDDQPLNLTSGQYTLMLYLYENHDTLVRHQDIATDAFAYPVDFNYQPGLAKHISRIREKIESIAPGEGSYFLQNARGIGYKLLPNPPPPLDSDS